MNIPCCNAQTLEESRYNFRFLKITITCEKAT